jgi:hypothetical protein
LVHEDNALLRVQDISQRIELRKRFPEMISIDRLGAEQRDPVLQLCKPRSQGRVEKAQCGRN